MKTLSSVIDRRASKGKSAENRRKFLERVRDNIREAMPNILNSGNLKDIGKNGGSVEIRKKTIQEPSFRFGKGGDNEHVLPGNKEFVAGDKIKKDQGGQGSGGKKGGLGGEGEDPFVIQISQEEFLNFLFEDLELPDLVRKDLADVTETKPRTAGYSTSGNPSRLALQKSMRMAHQRRIALRGSLGRSLDEALEEPEDETEEEKALRGEEAERLSVRLKAIPFLDSMDLRYRASVQEEKPLTSAVMVCVMDNSGSMGEREKTLARKFFYLLYLFLSRKYEKIELVFLHHTDSAKEVSEAEFFSIRETGGTKVSSALDLLSSMIPSRLNPSQKNIYVCQCSDGDNYESDNPICEKVLSEKLLDAVQHWAYIQIDPENRWSSGMDDFAAREPTLWDSYQKVSQSKKNLALRHVSQDADIYPVFRKLFEKKHEVR